MKKQHSLDMNQLFGFSDLTGQVDINTPKLAARLGAKVGVEAMSPIAIDSIDEHLDTAQLLGFETMATEVDFSDASVASRVGAKIGGSEPI